MEDMQYYYYFILNTAQASQLLPNVLIQWHYGIHFKQRLIFELWSPGRYWGYLPFRNPEPNKIIIIKVSIHFVPHVQLLLCNGGVFTCYFRLIRRLEVNYLSLSIAHHSQFLPSRYTSGVRRSIAAR